MKKYVQEATDENIWTSIKNNTFGRNKDITINEQISKSAQNL